MKRLLLAVAAGTLSFAAQAQVPQYGTSINLEQARKAIAAGQAVAVPRERFAHGAVRTAQARRHAHPR